MSKESIFLKNSKKKMTGFAEKTGKCYWVSAVIK
jgi:hypothetical protein